MSGGSLDYFYSRLEEHVGDFQDAELDDLVKDLAELFHDREWFLSADTCEGDWREARDKFKQKWFGEGARKERVEKYLTDFGRSVMDQLGLSDRYCKNCSHWTEEEKGSVYGNCGVHPSMLWHRSEQCDHFLKKV